MQETQNYYLPRSVTGVGRSTFLSDHIDLFRAKLFNKRLNDAQEVLGALSKEQVARIQLQSIEDKHDLRSKASNKVS